MIPNAFDMITKNSKISNFAKISQIWGKWMVDIIFLHFKLHVGTKNRKYFSNTSRHCVPLLLIILILILLTTESAYLEAPILKRPALWAPGRLKFIFFELDRFVISNFSSLMKLEFNEMWTWCSRTNKL